MTVLAGQQRLHRQEGGVSAGEAPHQAWCNNVASVTTGVVTVDDHGAAHVLSAPNVVQLDPEQALFDAMVEGWERQQRARFLKE